MSKENKSPFALEDNEREAAWYIGGILVLLLSICFLAYLTHVVLTP